MFHLAFCSDGILWPNAWTFSSTWLDLLLEVWVNHIISPTSTTSFDFFGGQKKLQKIEKFQSRSPEAEAELQVILSSVYRGTCLAIQHYQSLFAGLLERSEQAPSYGVAAVPLQHQWSLIGYCPDKPRNEFSNWKVVTSSTSQRFQWMGCHLDSAKFTRLIGGKWKFRSLRFHGFFSSMSPASSRKSAYCILSPANNEEEQDECLQDIVGTNMSFRKALLSRSIFYGGICILCISISCRNHLLPKNHPLAQRGVLLFVRFCSFGRCRSS